VVPDRFFWALPPGEEGEEGAETVPATDEMTIDEPPSRGPRRIH